MFEFEKKKCRSADFSVQKEFDFLEMNFRNTERKKPTSRIKDCPYLKSTVVFMDNIGENTTCTTTKSSFLAGTVADDMRNILSAIGMGSFLRFLTGGVLRNSHNGWKWPSKVPSIVVTALISVCYCCYRCPIRDLKRRSLTLFQQKTFWSFDKEASAARRRAASSGAQSV